MTILSTKQDPRCQSNGHMAFCSHHPGGEPIRNVGNQSFSMFYLQNPDDIRSGFRNLGVQARADTIDPNNVRVSVLVVRGFNLGFLQAGDDPLEVHPTTDNRLIKALRDEPIWDGKCGDAWVRAFPLLAHTDDMEEPVPMKLLRWVRCEGDITDTIDLEVNDEGFAFCHVGFVLSENPDDAIFGSGVIRLQNDKARDYWFDADNGDNVLYLGMLRINTKTGNRAEFVEVRSAADIMRSLEAPAIPEGLAALLRAGEDGGNLGGTLSALFGGELSTDEIDGDPFVKAIRARGGSVIGIGPDGKPVKL